MCAQVKENTEVLFSGRRRSSTHQSTGLDYSTCSHVEGDLLIRIRSLLLSRHLHHPPRTPCSSDDESWTPRNHDFLTSFDFSTAKSVAKRAHAEAGRLSLPNPRIGCSASLQPAMEQHTASLIPIRAARKKKGRAVFRNSSSVEDLNDRVTTESTPVDRRLINDKTIQDNLLTCRTPCPLDGEKSSFTTPRLCLLPKEHVRPQYDLSSIAPTIANLGLRTRDMKAQPPKLVPTEKAHSVAEDGEQNPKPSNQNGDDGCKSDIKMDNKASQKNVTGDSCSKTLALEDSSHAAPLTSEIRQLDYSEQEIGSEARDVHTVQIVLPIHARPSPPSVQSGASKTSNYRHALLKTSATSSEPLDLGLPVQPVLTLPSDAASSRFQRHSAGAFDMQPKEFADSLTSGLDSKAMTVKDSASPEQHMEPETAQARRPVVYSVDPFATKPSEPCHSYESLEDAARTAAEYLSRAYIRRSSSMSSTGSTDACFEHQLEDRGENIMEPQSGRSVETALNAESGDFPVDQRTFDKHLFGEYAEHQAENSQEHEAAGQLRNSSNLTDTRRSPPCHISLSQIPTRFSSYERMAASPETYQQLADRLESPYLNATKPFRVLKLPSPIPQLSTSSSGAELASCALETVVQSTKWLNSAPLAANASSLIKGAGHVAPEEELTTINPNENSKSSWMRFRSKPVPVQEEINGKDTKPADSLGDLPKKTFRDKVAKQLSIDHLSRKAGHKLRSVASMSSTRSKSDDEPRRGLWKSSNSKLSPNSPIMTGVKQTRAMFHDKLGLAPVYSSRGLGADGEGYTTEFTSLPARNYHLHIQPKIFRSKSSMSDGQLYPSATSAQHNRFAGAQMSETLTQTIEDIEHLLNEALFIAHQAAENQDVDLLPRSFQDAPAAPKSGRGWKIDEKRNWHRLRKSYFKHMFHSHPFEDHHSSRSLHANNDTRTLPSEGTSPESFIEFDMKHEASHQTNDVASGTSKQDGLFSPELVSAKNSRRGEDDGELSFTPMPSCLKTSMKVTAPLEAVETLYHAEAVNAAQENGETRSDNAKKTKHSRLPIIRNSNADPASLIPPELAVPFESLSGHTMGRDRASSLVAKLDRRTSCDPNGEEVNPYKEDIPAVSRHQDAPGPSHHKYEANEFRRVFRTPSIEPRGSSLILQKSAKHHKLDGITSAIDISRMHRDPERATLHSIQSFDGSLPSDHETDLYTPTDAHKHTRPGRNGGDINHYELHDINDSNLPQQRTSSQQMHHAPHNKLPLVELRRHSHVSLKGSHSHGFSLSRSHKRQPIARDWSPFRKRFVATVACISTALIGILVGIYAGEVPSIQYYIADFDHVAILGNVVFYIGIAIPTMVFWPLPLLHGRKPYILASMSIAMPLLFPQAVVVSVQRSPYVSTYRVGLILPRAVMGFVLGFANMNFLAILTDLFGASLQSGNPHQEVVDEYDVRRHGGGLGVWLGIWTWCYMGSIGVGFMIGACIINTYSPDWGLYVSIIIIAAVLVLNVITPEVRRSAYRRSVTEVRTNTEISRRVAKGEVKMHRVQTGPSWWGEEFHHGVQLSLGMVRQPGFLIMAVYVAWIYGQIVLVIVLLGSLMSKVYHMPSPYVGAVTCAIPIGAFVAIPFQKASLFSRARHHPQRTDSMTFQERVSWSSHLVRRAIFTLVLPFAGLAYTLSSTGPPIPFIIPVIFAALMAFLSNLAIAECNGIIMEAFDTSDLQPGLTGRRRGASGDRSKHKRTNYSSFPRVSSAFAITQGLGFLIAAAATGVGGVAQRFLGQQEATGVMAGILLILTILLLGVLIRWKEVQIIPAKKTADMERWGMIRKSIVQRQKSQTTSIGQSGMMTPVQLEDEPWRPTIIGNPSGKTRRMSILELGSLSRWSEIRRKNRLVDEEGLEARHPNLATLGSARNRLREVNIGVIDTMRERSKLGRDGSRKTAMSESSATADSDGNGDLGERHQNVRLMTGVANGKREKRVAE